MSDPLTPQQQQQSSSIPPTQTPLSIQQILVKMIIDSQNNINRLIAGQERLIDIQQRQMIYIDTLVSKIGSNEPPANNSVGTEQKQENIENKTTTGKPVNTKSIT